MKPEHMRNIRPVGTDVDGNGIWLDDEGERYNSGEPLTDEEEAEVKAASVDTVSGSRNDRR